MGVEEEAGKIASGAIDALKTNPMCLAVLLLSCVVLWLGYLSLQNENERRSRVNIEILERCFPTQGGGQR